MNNYWIRWRMLNQPGHETANLYHKGNYWHLNGRAEFEDKEKPCELSYEIICNNDWHTLSAKVIGNIGDEIIDLLIKKNANNEWELNGKTISSLGDCIDIDLSFSPATNMLPIRRLNLSIGEEHEVCAAWLQFPKMELEPLKQTYKRKSKFEYEYQNKATGFKTDLQVNELGFITLYPDSWCEDGLYD